MTPQARWFIRSAGGMKRDGREMSVRICPIGLPGTAGSRARCQSAFARSHGRYRSPQARLRIWRGGLFSASPTPQMPLPNPPPHAGSEHDDPEMLHFAYGSNMSVALMRRRCPLARLEGRACLPGYRFVITGSGFASVVPAPGSCVHGLLWRVTPRDVAALNAYENLDGGLYRAVTMGVVSQRRRRAALVYIGCDRVHGRPRPGYLDIVTRAAQEARFPPRYLLCLSRWASAQNSTPIATPPPYLPVASRDW